MRGVILVGFMGSGKSSVARALGQELALPVMDLDELIETTANQSIPAIFSSQGELAFREIETTCLSYVINQSVILATGGGVVESIANRQFLHETTNLVVWLKSDFDTYYKRIVNDKMNQRPIVNQNSKEQLAKIEHDRRVFYKEVADLVVNVSHLTVNQVASKISQSIIK